MTDTKETTNVEGAADDAAKDHGVLYIGMDLGTSRTAVHTDV